MTIWTYEADGAQQRGLFLDFYDRGGTDVSYKFHRLNAAGQPIVYDNGGRLVDMISGERLKAASPVREA